MSNPNGKILDRIRAMLNLARDKGATPAEAATAAAMAQRLLEQHNLSMAEVETATGQQAEGYVRDDYTIGGTKPEELWRAHLAHYVAQANFCRVVRLIGTGMMAFVGKRSNIEVVQYTYEFLVREITRLADAGWAALDPAKKTRRTYVKGRRDRWGYWVAGGYRDVKVTALQWKRAFCLGAVAEVGQRLKRQSEEFKAQGGAATALVVRVDQELALAVQEKLGRTHSTKARTTLGSAYGAGRAAGRGISINPGVRGGASPTGALLLR